MAKVDLPDVYRVISKGRTYYYAWKGKGAPRLPGKPGSPEFIAALKAAQDSRGAPDTKRMAGLIHAYRASKAWKLDLSEGTRKQWSRWLDRIGEDFNLPVAAFAKADMRKDIRIWRDGLSEKKDGKGGPRSADMGKQVLSRLMSFAVCEGLLTANPCEGLDNLYANDRSEIIWEEADLKALAGVASPEIMWAARLASLTGMRQDDCRKLKWSEVGTLAIERKAGKSRTGRGYLVPVYAELQALLAEIPNRSDHVLTNTRGQPWRSGLSDSFHDAAAKAKVDKHFHDLRGTAATHLYLAGFVLREIAEILAWEEDQVERIINRYVRRDAMLRDRIARLDAYRKNAR